MSIAAMLAQLPPEDRRAMMAGLPAAMQDELAYEWRFWARPEQMAPEGQWGIWLALAGRGWGKTAAGTGWINDLVRHRGLSRLFLVGPTAADVRDIMVLGESGIIAKAHPDWRPTWHPSKRMVEWPNQAMALCFSSEEPERLRGVQAEAAWCDELCLQPGTVISTARGGVPVQDVCVGDLVRTRVGLRPVASVAMTGVTQRSWQIETDTGRRIVSTGGHPIWVEGKGWVAAHLVTEGDVLLTIPVESNGMEHSGIDGALGTTQAEAENSCIVQFTNFTTDGNLSRQIQDQKHALGNVDTGYVQVFPERVVLSRPCLWSGPVYNLTVEGEHEYFANGILTHNCSWSNVTDTWDMLQFCLRLGANPQIFISTTPKPIPLIRDLVKRSVSEPDKVRVTRGKTTDNASNLAASYIEEVLKRYSGTRLGQQELDGEILEESERALWKRSTIDEFRVPQNEAPPFPDGYKRIGVAVDPSVTSGEKSDECGIIVGGLAHNDHVYILRDLSARLKPHEWASRSVQAYHAWSADFLAAETNNGGDMVKLTINMVPDGQNVAFKKLTASKGKVARAEPVAALYEQGRVHHVGDLSALELQLVTFDPLEGHKSPDRYDALVWLVTELVLNKSQHKFW